MREIIIIEQSSDSPFVEFNPNKGTLSIHGKSLLENTYDFYGPVLEAVKGFVNDEFSPLTVDVRFDYLNSSTSRYFMELLMILENSDADHEIKWYYEEGDDVIEEKGEQFKSLAELEFVISVLDLKRA